MLTLLSIISCLVGTRMAQIFQLEICLTVPYVVQLEGSPRATLGVHELHQEHPQFNSLTLPRTLLRAHNHTIEA